MKRTNYNKKLGYIGAGCGIMLFALFGLLPGSFLGGVVGLKIAGAILGLPVVSGVMSRLIVAASMVLGVMVSGIMFVTVFSLAGWVAGAAADALTVGKRNLTVIATKQ